ncbi:hypothetical protein K439DRAFT_907882 [Ramaria rubella]|nr:hypothetical protein K439DRAFT_907882 [Ramaria rubella]
MLFFSRQIAVSGIGPPSVAAAVEFAKANNLLGVLINACILAKVPSLIQGIKETGVLLATFAMRDMTDQPQNADTGIVDAVMRNGVLTFVDHSSRT